MNIISDYGNRDIVLGGIYSNSIERELDNAINGPERYQDSESLPNRENSSQGNGIRNNDARNGPDRKVGLAESVEILSGEMNADCHKKLIH